MSHPVARRLAGYGLGALALLAAAPALAADLGYPPYPGEPAPSRIYREERYSEELPPPPPPRPAPYGPRFAAGPGYAPPPPLGGCRTILKRRIDEDGDVLEKRVRICDEPGDGPRYRPSFYRPHPVPPADLPYGGWEGPPRW